MSDLRKFHCLISHIIYIYKYTHPGYIRMCSWLISPALLLSLLISNSSREENFRLIEYIYIYIYIYFQDNVSVALHHEKCKASLNDPKWSWPRLAVARHTCRIGRLSQCRIKYKLMFIYQVTFLIYKFHDHPVLYRVLLWWGGFIQDFIQEKHICEYPLQNTEYINTNSPISQHQTNIQQCTTHVHISVT